MRRFLPAFLMTVSAMLATVCAAFSVSSPQDAPAVLGGTAVFSSESSGATQAVWFDRNGNEIADGVTSVPDGAVLRTSLKIPKVTDGVVENGYFCVFTDGKNCEVTGMCRVICAPELSRDDEYTACTGIECHCAWLRARLRGVREEDLRSGSGWYRFYPDTESYVPVSGENYYVNGLSLGIGDVTPGEKCWYIYRAVTDTSTVEQRFYVYESVPVSNYDIRVAHILGDIEPGNGVYPVSFRPGESEKYEITEVRWEGKNTSNPTVFVTLNVRDGNMFQYNDGVFTVRCGDVLLTARTDGAPAAESGTMTVSATFKQNDPEPSRRDFTAQLNGTDGKITAEGFSSFSAYCLPAGMTVTQDGDVHYEGNGNAQCFIVARGKSGTSYGILSVSADSPQPPENVKITTSEIPGAVAGTGYSFKLSCDRGGAEWAETGNVLSGIGLALTHDGTVTGVPSKTGTFSFAVTVSYGSATDTRSFSITVSKQKAAYKVTFVKNRGTGDMPAVTVDASIGKYTVPECGFTPPSNKKFVYWEMNGKKVFPGEVLTLTTDVKLKAVYEADGSGTTKETGKNPETTAHVHSFETYEYNTRSHWAVCECGKTDGKEVHSFDENGVCTICGYAKPGKTSRTDSATGSSDPSDPDLRTGDETTRVITVIGENGKKVDIFVVVILIFICLCLAAAVIAFITAKKIR
ncbi:MAG: hypothetical protein IKS28_05135 [Clostridia bacterium]|nr:hypothetical protein [Clostridia bacterium]